jgi:hypothetical protein
MLYLLRWCRRLYCPAGCGQPEQLGRPYRTQLWSTGGQVSDRIEYCGRKCAVAEKSLFARQVREINEQVWPLVEAKGTEEGPVLLEQIGVQ